MQYVACLYRNIPAGVELEGMIWSHTALDNFELQGQVPETYMSDQTANISPFTDCEWYEWVKFYETTAQFPEAREVLGRRLGPSLDVEPAMTSKILKMNGQVINISSYRKLSLEELDDAKEKIGS